MTTSATHEQILKHRRLITMSLSCCLVIAPIVGCSESNVDTPSETEAAAVTQPPSATSSPGFADSVHTTLGGAWHTITETTDSGLTIVSEKFAVGTQMALDATRAAWIWSSDKSADGWGWIVDNAGDATEWARDTASQTWALTQQTSGEFSLWVRVTAEDGVAWARTTLPAAWRVTKDAAGKAIVWIDEHKIELAVAAAVIAVVVAGLLIAPEGVAPAVVRGAVSGTAAETTKFLGGLWNARDKTEQGATLQNVSHDLFLNIGKSVLGQCGSQVLQNLPADASA